MKHSELIVLNEVDMNSTNGGFIGDIIEILNTDWDKAIDDFKRGWNS